MDLVAALKSDPNAQVLSGVFAGLGVVNDQVAGTKEERAALARLDSAELCAGVCEAGRRGSRRPSEQAPASRRPVFTAGLSRERRGPD